jgi:DNA-binding transcriptional MerR regulator
MKEMTIGKLAAAAGVGIDTVRFYERLGLLREALRSESGYRRFTPDDLERLRFVRRAKALGFSLDEIADLLRLNDGRGSRAEIRDLAARRLAQITQDLRELTSIKTTLEALVHRCSGKGSAAGCPIVQAVLDTSTVKPTRKQRSATS